MEWTKEQREVIDADNSEIIVSAAAGSGKTAVMIERIVRLIGDGASPDRMLIVTYTNAAASEMKEKIRRRLQKEKDRLVFRKALEKIEYLEISTIHSFCQRLIRQQFHVIGIDPETRVCDSAERKIRFEEAYRKAVDWCAVNDSEAFTALKKAYKKNETAELVSELHSFIYSLPDPAEWAKNAVQMIPDEMNRDHPWFSAISEMVSECAGSIRVLFAKQQRMLEDECAVDKVRTLWTGDCELLELLDRFDRNEQDGIAGLRNFKMKNWNQRGAETVDELDWCARFKTVREDIKKLHARITELISLDTQHNLKDFSVMRVLTGALVNLTLKTAEIFGEEKRKHGLMDFNDMEHYALRILSDPLHGEAIANGFTHIFVDECQDVSAVQDAIIRKLKTGENDLFMVGDVKQSIYRFRLADPTIFLKRLTEYSDSPDAETRRIFLQHNFRSRPEILETTNTVFRSVMRKETAELDYGPKEELIPGRVTEGNIPVTVDLIQNVSRETKRADIEIIADGIAAEIRSLLKEKRLDTDHDEYYQYRDIVILMPRVASIGKKLADLLSEREIPVYFDGGKDYFQLDEIREVRDLLDVISNPRQDMKLIGVLKRTPFGFSNQDLSVIRLKNRRKGISFYDAFVETSSGDDEIAARCGDALRRMEDWRFLAETMPMGDFLWYLIRESGYYYVNGTRENGSVRQANLRMLSDKAGEYEKNGICSIGQLTEHLAFLTASGDQNSASTLGEQDDLVRIMTMHKSKGLQFPVVFCTGMDKPKGNPHALPVRLHKELGICLRYRNGDLRIERSTAADDVFAWRIAKEERAERIRLLYVAMTRAQEKLYLVSTQTQNPLWSYPDCIYRTDSAKSEMDYVMPALLSQNGAEYSTGCAQPLTLWNIRVTDDNTQKTVENEKVIHNLAEWIETTLSENPVDRLWKNDSDHRDDENRVRKISVTSLLSEEPAAESTDETITDKRTEDLIAQLGRLEQEPAFRRGEAGISGARRGTATHRLLSLIPLDGAMDERHVRGVAASLCGKGILSREEAAVINYRQVAAFFASPVGKRMLQSTDVRREWDFDCRVGEKGNMILQGIIDCAFEENGSWVIVDYKTDHVADSAELAERYGRQIRLYASSLARITGRPVKEMWLYSLSLSEAVPVTESEVDSI
ncbi:MAG: helicase-exonuclease AddAB subunit AddA [Clostridia bacterium]|nr:helicase-exonuclease AddAB subunit AddA [Clostridia bacterium]